MSKDMESKKEDANFKPCDVFRARWGSFFFNESGNPAIEVIAPDGTIKYLMPFRGYSFQLCDSASGQGDCGSTPVFGLKNLDIVPRSSRWGTYEDPMLRSNLNHESQVKLFICSLIMNCLHHAERSGNWGWLSPKFIDFQNMLDDKIYWLHNEEELNFCIFVEAVYLYILSGGDVDREYISKYQKAAADTVAEHQEWFAQQQQETT